jgi:hypothetical protein
MAFDTPHAAFDATMAARLRPTLHCALLRCWRSPNPSPTPQVLQVVPENKMAGEWNTGEDEVGLIVL